MNVSSPHKSEVPHSSLSSRRFLLIGALLLTLGMVTACGNSAKRSFSAERNAWFDAKVWHDGLAEKAVYDAQMVIYGTRRNFPAILFVNSEQFDTVRGVKAGEMAAKGTVVEALKLNWVAEVPTENYPYRFQQTSHLRREDLSTLRSLFSSQEHCGTTFKIFYRDKHRASMYSQSYFPDEGEKYERFRFAEEGVPYDVLPLWLRSLPQEVGTTRSLAMISTMVSNRYTKTTGGTATFEVKAAETLNTPLGDIPCVRVEMTFLDTKETFHMATDRERIMVRRVFADGSVWRLRSQERLAYWERP